MFGDDSEERILERLDSIRESQKDRLEQGRSLQREFENSRISNEIEAEKTRDAIHEASKMVTEGLSSLEHTFKVGVNRLGQKLDYQNKIIHEQLLTSKDMHRMQSITFEQGQLERMAVDVLNEVEDRLVNKAFGGGEELVHFIIEYKLWKEKLDINPSIFAKRQEKNEFRQIDRMIHEVESVIFDSIDNRIITFIYEKRIHRTNFFEMVHKYYLFNILNKLLNENRDSSKLISLYTLSALAVERDMSLHMFLRENLSSLNDSIKVIEEDLEYCTRAINRNKNFVDEQSSAIGFLKKISKSNREKYNSSKSCIETFNKEVEKLNKKLRALLLEKEKFEEEERYYREHIHQKLKIAYSEVVNILGKMFPDIQWDAEMDETEILLFLNGDKKDFELFKQGNNFEMEINEVYKDSKEFEKIVKRTEQIIYEKFNSLNLKLDIAS